MDGNSLVRGDLSVNGDTTLAQVCVRERESGCGDIVHRWRGIAHILTSTHTYRISPWEETHDWPMI